MPRRRGHVVCKVVPMNRRSCGIGLAEHSSLPTKLAALLGSVAETLAVHTHALDPTDASARAELDAYRRLVDEHRRAAELLSTIGKEMEGYRDLPVAKHTPEAASSRRALEAFEDVVKRERELLALLEEKVRTDQKMLVEMVVASGA
jgi:hypothetical protein